MPPLLGVSQSSDLTTEAQSRPSCSFDHPRTLPQSPPVQFISPWILLLNPEKNDPSPTPCSPETGWDPHSP